MNKSLTLRIVLFITAVSFLLAACGSVVPAAVQDEEVDSLKIAIVTTTTLEEPWNTALLQALERVEGENPHGLTVPHIVQENVSTPDGERVMREFANTGEYGIIWAHGLYPDAIVALHSEYPDILWAASGSGYEPMGDNAYWVQMYVHEAAYLLGIMAGMMTETNTIGAVAAYPYPNVNTPINGYVSGAREVNPDVAVKMTYIESWFDPPKAKESALAQIAAGADFIYAERFGPFEATAEEGVSAFGHYVDQNEIAPETVISSTIARWDPVANYLIDEWYAHVAEGAEYDAPMEAVYFLMAEGGTDIAPFHEQADEIPAEVIERVEEAKQAILDGELEVPFDEEPVESD